MTTDEYQIPIPPSFHAVHADARGRLLLPVSEFRQRYELCEDMAQMLVNGVFIAPEDRASKTLVDGDVLAIWPPIAGG